MKKIFTLLVAVVMMITLTACQGTGGTTTEGTEGGTTSNTINVYTRDASSGTREAFEDAIGLGEDLTDAASEVSSNGDMATRVGQDPNGIGYVSLTTDFEANNVKPLSFEGVEASNETVLDGSYLMQRPFKYMTRASGDFESDDKEQLVAAFIAYITESTEGLTVVSEAGGIVDMTNARPWSEIAAEYPVLNNDNSGITIRTGGSTSVEKVVEAALQAFQPLAGNVQYAMSQSGSGDAQPRTLGDEKDGPNAVDIGFTSREFKDDEDVSGAMVQGEMCKDAVVIIVEANNAKTDITASEAYDIFSGAKTTFDAE